MAEALCKPRIALVLSEVLRNGVVEADLAGHFSLELLGEVRPSSEHNGRNC